MSIYVCNMSLVFKWRRERFEPSKRFPVYTLSKRAPSTTRPPLLNYKHLNLIKALKQVRSIFLKKKYLLFIFVSPSSLFLYLIGRSIVLSPKYVEANKILKSPQRSIIEFFFSNSSNFSISDLLKHLVPQSVSVTLTLVI